MHVQNMYVHVQGRLDSSKAWFTLLPDPPLLLHFQFFSSVFRGMLNLMETKPELIQLITIT